MVQPQAVTFDLGGVLINDAFAGLMELEGELQLPPRALCDEFRTGAVFRRCEVGELTMAEFFVEWAAQVQTDHGVELPVERIKSLFAGAHTARPEMVQLIRRLAGRYRLAVMTNNIREGRSDWEGQLPMECFDIIVDSSEVGLRKPDPAIFEYLLHRLELNPSEVVFVDDWEPNLAPAAAMGIGVLHFTDATSCATGLRGLGIDPA